MTIRFQMGLSSFDSKNGSGNYDNNWRNGSTLRRTGTPKMQFPTAATPFSSVAVKSNV
jgi:hypothetical protein